MIVIILGIAVVTNAAIVPLTDLLPPDYPDPNIQNDSDQVAKVKRLYVLDNLEKRFDDASDKSLPPPVVLADSPYGPVPAGSGLEGQYTPDNIEKSFDPGLYVPDNIEKNFDDGSDKALPAPVPLADSPFGPVPAGSGLEGQYVADNLEKSFDPGLYVPDNIEKQFDGGLYRSEVIPTPPDVLIQSPFGLVKAGFGLEGQYIDDNLEKQFDNGQYADGHIEKQFDDGLYKGETTVQPNSIGIEDKKYKDGVAHIPHGLIQSGVGFIPSK